MKLGPSTTMLPVVVATLLMAQGCAKQESTAPAPAASAPPATAPAEAPAEAAPAAAEGTSAAPADTTAAEAVPAAAATAPAPAAAAAANGGEAGKKVYNTYCVTCHGTSGKGDGPAGGGLNPKPANFAAGVFKYDANGNGTKGDIQDIEAIAHDGAAKHGGSPLMAPWPMISPADLQAVAEYIKSLHGA